MGMVPGFTSYLLKVNTPDTPPSIQCSCLGTARPYSFLFVFCWECLLSVHLISISAWRSTEVPHKAELENVWLHVKGVPHTLRHFLGMWAVGSLVGKTVDVDLTSLRRRAIVRIQVAMLHPGVLGDPSDEACPIAKADAGQVQGLRVPFLQGAS
jgi:hypothetical protein